MLNILIVFKIFVLLLMKVGTEIAFCLWSVL